MATEPNETVEKIDQTITFYSWTKGLLVSLVILLLVLSGAVQFITLNEVRTTTDRIESCIDPQGACYKSGDRRSSAAVRTINEAQKRTITIAAYCANRPVNNTLKELEECINKELAK